MTHHATIDVVVERIHDESGPVPARDVLAVEEPLEIRLEASPPGQTVRKTVSVTMRTPGHDAELAAGFLFTEGIVRDRAAIEHLGQCGVNGNVVRVRLAPDTPIDLARLERNFYTTSSCGVCGKTSIEALRATSRYPLHESALVVDTALIHRLPQALRTAQAVFDATGGLHASALFDADGKLRCLREDVGRHNALDKVIGGQLLAGHLPVYDRVLVVSGRASFELVQKAMMAGIPILVAVGAPSSLAVQLAEQTGMTLIGFARDGRFNVYTGRSRVRDQNAATLAAPARSKAVDLAVAVGLPFERLTDLTNAVIPPDPPDDVRDEPPAANATGRG